MNGWNFGLEFGLKLSEEDARWNLQTMEWHVLDCINALLD